MSTDHFWEPPGDRHCARCGVDYDEHEEPDMEQLLDEAMREARRNRPHRIERYKLVRIEDE